MHELSIAISIAEIAADESERHAGSQVEAVHLKLGALSGVVKDALLFAWEMACEVEGIAGARLIVDDVAVQIRCPTCRVETNLKGLIDLRCPRCGGAAEVLQGRELEVFALELVERKDEERVCTASAHGTEKRIEAQR